MMKKISQREKAILGYSSPQAQDSKCSSKVPNSSRDSNSDIDFSDVFGGPPRRSSFHEIQYGNLSGDDDDLRLSGLENVGEDSNLSRSSWSGYGEKPVFGVESLSRSRHSRNDFFDDIFKADQSHSPRMSAGDLSASAPGSRALSPVARPLPSRAEPFASPAQFSLPAELPKAISSASSPRFSSQAIQDQDVLARPTYRQSRLLKEYLLNREELTKDSASVGTSAPANFTRENTERSEAPNDGSHFHFSIHKWATKGTPLIMSLAKRNSIRSREKSKYERWSSINETPDINSVANDSYKTGMSGEECPALCSDEASTTSGFNEEHGNSLLIASTNGGGDEFRRTGAKDNIAQPKAKLQRNSEAPKEKDEPDVKSVSSISSQVELSKVKDKVTINDGIGQRVAKTEEILPVDSVSSLKPRKNRGFETLGATGKKSEKKEVSGKVKEFVKIFNQDYSSKHTAHIDGESKSFRWEGTANLKAENEATSNMPKMQDGIRGPDIKKGKTGSNNNVKVKENRRQLERKIPHVEEKLRHHVKQTHENHILSPSQKENIARGEEPAVENVKAYASSIDLTYEDGFVIRELSRSDKPSEEDSHQEQIKESENKILLWSKGKEGNIRALLSTLQYILWPNSGWKPVPLVDVIEANAVKRAYQKALLCLHPDKLQQKGAASYQKYMAEKVFDILQEAWDHFNSLGAL